MLAVVLGELVILAGMWLAFIAIHMRSSWWRHPDGQPNWVGRQLMAMAVASLGEAVSLVLLGTGHMPPLWVYMLGFGLMDAVLAGWLVLQWRARRAADEHANGPA